MHAACRIPCLTMFDYPRYGPFGHDGDAQAVANGDNFQPCNLGIQAYFSALSSFTATAPRLGD